jgi:hypothetical protein
MMIRWARGNVYVDLKKTIPNISPQYFSECLMLDCVRSIRFYLEKSLRSVSQTLRLDKIKQL